MTDKARHIDEWHEDIGPALWWTNPVTEAPYVGSPLDCGRSVAVTVGDEEFVAHVGGWPGYHEWWTPIGPMPDFPDAAPRPLPSSSVSGG